ncbi:MAG: Ig-like domain repeat protein [Anaeromyxobacter sp.]
MVDVSYTYDAQNRLSTVSVKLNPKNDAQVAAGLAQSTYTTTYTYDGTSTRVAKITQSDGTSLSFEYTLVDGSYRVSKVTDALDQVTTFAYDTAAKRTAVTDALGLVTVCDYDAAGNFKSIQSAAGKTRVDYSYDATQDVQTATDGMGRTVTTTFVKGNLTEQVDSAGNRLVRTYDAQNQLLSETIYSGASSTDPLTTRYVYDALGKNQLRFVISAEGRVTEQRYDANGQRVASIEYRAGTYSGSAAESDLVAWTAAADRTQTVRTDYAFDLRGQLSAQTSYTAVDAAGVGVGSGATTVFVYDERGRLVKTVSADTKAEVDCWYDGFGRLIGKLELSSEFGVANQSATLYDDAANRTTTTLANGLVTLSTYDAAGRLVSVVQSNAGTELGTTRYFYDRDDRLVMTQDPTGQRSWVLYDAAGRKVADIDPAGGLTEYIHDASNRVTQQIRYANPVDTARLVDSSGNPTIAFNGNPGASASAVTLDALRPSAAPERPALDGVEAAKVQADLAALAARSNYLPALSENYLNEGEILTVLNDGQNAVPSVQVSGLPSKYQVSGGYYQNLKLQYVLVADIEYVQQELAIAADGRVDFTVPLHAGVKLVRLIDTSTGATKAIYSENTGRIRSYEVATTDPAYGSLRNRTYTYDQAVYICALVEAKEGAALDRAVMGLVGTQLADGSFPFSVNMLSGEGDAYVRNGSVAWCLYSLTRYLALRGSAAPEAVRVAAQKAADYLLTQQATTGIQAGSITAGRGRYVNGELDAGYVLPWASTEHNIDAFFALRWAYEVFKDDRYARAAEGIDKNLMRSHFNVAGGYFYQGLADASTVDTGSALDCLTWGAYFLAATGRMAEARSSLQRAVAVYGTTVNGVEGFMPYSAQDEYPGAASTVWSEGTLGAAVAFYKLGDKANWLKYLGEVEQLRTAGGYFQYANVADSTYEISTMPSAIGTAWDAIARLSPESIMALPDVAAGAQDVKSWSFYDAAGRLAWQVDGLGYVTQTQYDGASRVLSVTKLATPVDTSKLGNGIGVTLTLAGTATSTRLEMVSGSTGQYATRLLTATVLGADGLPNLGATGTISFFAGQTCVGAAEVVNGVATLTVTSLPVGSQQLTAVYGGDSAYAGSASAVVAATVDAAPNTTTELRVSTARIAPGGSVTLTAIVAGANPGSTVKFFRGSVELATVAVVNGVASYVASGLPAGVSTVKAVYQGDGSNQASTSALIDVTQLTAVTATLAVSSGSVVAGAPVTLTATISSSTASGTVSFFRDSTLLGSAAVTGGVATFITDDLASGTASLTAVYSGDSVNTGAISAAASTTVSPATSTTVLAVTRAADGLGAARTLTATVSGVNNPAGTVSFYSGGTLLGTATLTGGVATLSVTNLTVGTASLKATYVGDTRNATSTSAVVAETVATAPTTTTLSAPASIIHGNSVTLTATVVGTNGVVPTGTVTFFTGTTVLGRATISNGLATLTVSSLPGGSNALSATYTGSTNCATSATSTALNRTVTTAPVTVTLSSSATAAAQGSAITFTAKLAQATGATLATGKVAFYSGATELAQVDVVDGVAALTVTSLAVGAPRITAKYLGDTNNAQATSNIVTPTISRTTTTALTAVAGGPYTNNVTLTATITGSSPTGLVTFFAGLRALGTATVSGGRASLVVYPPVGTAVSYTAVYAGDANNATSVSSAASATSPGPGNTSWPTSSLAASTTVLTFSSATTARGTAVVLTGTVSGGSGTTRTGTVSFFKGTTLLGSATVGTGNKASLTLSDLPVGANAITAVYSGDASAAYSTSAAVTETVTTAATATTLFIPGATIPAGSATFVAQVTGATPGGTVTFYDGATALGTGTIVNGLATFTTASLAAGSHSIKATYGGDSNNGPSTSTVAAVTVSAARTTTTTGLSVSSSTPAFGTPVTLTATVTGGSPTGTVSFFNGSTLLGSVTLSGSTAALVVKSLPVGAASLRAVFSGDTSTTSSAGTASVTVQQVTTTASLTISSLVFSEEATLTASVAGVNASGVVTFYAGAISLGTASVVNGQATLVTSALPAGAVTLKASYAGDTKNKACEVTQVTTVAPHATSLVVTSSTPPAGMVVGANVLLTATVSGRENFEPVGTVTFLSGTRVIGTAALSYGKATLATELTASDGTITAVYGGSAEDAASIGKLEGTVKPAPTSLVLTSAATTSTAALPLRLTARVTGAGILAPSGTVRFWNGSTQIGTGTLNGGVATLTVGSLTPSASAVVGADGFTTDAGTSSLWAEYLGDTGNAASKSDLPVISATTLTAPATASMGASVTLTARVAGKLPQGTVTFLTGSTVLGTAAVVNGVATLAVKFGNTGPITVRASYAGDLGNVGSFSTTSTITVSGGTAPGAGPTLGVTRTEVTLTAGGVEGAPSKLTAMVIPGALLTVVDADRVVTGTVSFFDNMQLIGTAEVINGKAELAVTNTGLGNLLAVYSGDKLSAGSTGALDTGLKTPTRVQVGASKLKLDQGASVTLVAQVTGFEPSGTVTFYRDGASIGTGTISGGVATLTTSSLAAGTFKLTAKYAGNTVNASSTSAEVSVTVNAVLPASTTTLTVSATSVQAGNPVTLTAAVAGTTPTGTVTFFTGGVAIGSADLVSGQAVLTVSTLTKGTQSITAVYSGDTANKTSAAAAKTVTVQAATPTTTLTASTRNALVGAQVTLTARVSGAVNPTGKVTFYAGGNAIGTVDTVNGVATLTTTQLGAGSLSLTATYQADDRDNASAASGAVTVFMERPASSVTALATGDVSCCGPLEVQVQGTKPTGTVTFLLGSTVLGTVQVVDGIASLTGVTLPTGAGTFTAAYSGDGQNAASAVTFSRNVTKAGPETKLTVSPAGSVAVGTPVVLTAQVANPDATGTILFWDGNSPFASASLVNGVASVTVSNLSAMGHALKAVYGGDATNLGSSSATTVLKVMAAPVSVTLSRSAASVAQGEALTLTASVTGTSPTGKVTFLSGTTVLGTASLVSGVATLTVSQVSLATGSQSLSAVYAGDSSNATAVSGALVETVTAGTMAVQVVQDATDRAAVRILDRDGLLRASIDGEGYLTEFVYDASGRQVQSTAYATKVSGFINAASIAAQVATARSTGDLTGLRPASVATDDLVTFTYYDARGQKVAEVDPKRYLTELAYDANGKLVQTTRYASAVAANVTITATTSLATLKTGFSGEVQTSTADWDGLGHLRSEVNVEGTSTTYDYDQAWNLVRKTVAASTADQRVLRTQYDALGRVTAELLPEGAAKVVSGELTEAAAWALYAVRHTYDAAGRKVATTDVFSHRTVFFYDEAGRLRFTVDAAGEVAETTYAALGHALSTNRFAKAILASDLGSLAGGVLTSDALAKLDSARGDASEQVLNQRTTFQYDARGSQNAAIDAYGGGVRTSYDAFGQAVRTVQKLDLAGKEVVSAIFYDRRGQQTSTVADVGGLAVKTAKQYDAFGRLIRTVDANGGEWKQTYDQLGRVVESIDPLTNRRVTEYDAFSRVLKQFDAAGHPATVYTYDTAGRSVTMTTPENVAIKTTHDRFGATVEVSTSKGGVQELLRTSQYDVNGNLTKSFAGGTLVEERTYDHGRLLRTYDLNRNVVEYGYDAVNRVCTRTVDPGTGGLNLVTTYGFDAKGQTTCVTGPGENTSTKYDAKGQVTEVTQNGITTRYSYDLAGRTLRVTVVGGTTTEHQYDALGRRVATVVDPDGLKLTQAFAYDKNGNVVRRTDGNGNVTRMAYDEANRLAFTVDPAGGVQQTAYDKDGRVTQVTTYATPIETKGLDAITDGAAKRTEITNRLKPGTAALPNMVESRFYNSDGQLQYTIDALGGITELTYDGSGNVVDRRTYAKKQPTWAPDPLHPLARPEGTDVDQRVRTVYDALNRVIYTVDGTNAVVKFIYDANVNATVGSVTTNVAYKERPEGLSPTATGAALKTDLDTWLNTTRAGVTTRQVGDRAGRVRRTIDGAGGVIDRTFGANGAVIKQVAYATALLSTDAVDKVLSFTADDRVTLFAYDTANRLVYQLNAAGGITKQEYDAAGNVIRSIAYAYAQDPLSVVSGWTGVASGFTPVVTAGSDRITRAVYDSANRLVFSVDGIGAVVERTYDGAGHVIGTTAYANRITPDTAPTISALGVRSGLPAADANNDRITLVAYDAAGRQRYTVDAQGGVKGTEYDGAGRVTRTTSYATPVLSGLSIGAGAVQIWRAVVESPAADRTDSYEYDASGRVVLSRDALLQTEKFEYDAVGSKIRYTNKNNVVWDYTYDAAGRLTEQLDPAVQLTYVDAQLNVEQKNERLATRMTYDGLGNVLTRTEAADRSDQRITSYQYDSMGRQVRTSLPTDDGTETFTQVWYDVFGNAVANRDVLGNKAFKAYDKAGRVRYEVDAAGYVTGYERNAFGEALKLTRYAADIKSGLPIADGTWPTTTTVRDLITPKSHTDDRVVETDYDRLGRATEVRQPSAWVSDTYGHVSARAKTQTTYDAFGQVSEVRALKSVNNSGVEQVWVTTSHLYDRLGREVRTLDPGKYLTVQEYDALGNLTKRAEYATPNQTLTSTTTSADDRVVAYEYDLLNRKVAETLKDVVLSVDPKLGVKKDLTTRYAYDGVGNLTLTTDALGKVTRSIYDALGRTQAVVAPTRTSTADNSALAPLTTYERDAFGNVTVQHEWAGGASNLETGEAVAGEERKTITRYNRAGNAVQVKDAMGYSHSMTYDKAGHALSQSQTVTGNDHINRTLFTRFEYDALGQQKRIITPGLATKLGVNQYGGAIVDPVTSPVEVVCTMVYNAFGEMTSRTTASEVETFDYDGAGRQWRTSSGEGTIKVTLYDLLGNKTAEISSAGALDLSLSAYSTAAAVDTLDAKTGGVRRTEFVVDALGRATKQLLPWRQDSTDAQAIRPEVNQVFDRWGNITSQSDARNSGWLTLFQYNAQNKLLKRTQPDLNGGASGPTSFSSYDELGREIGNRDANGNLNQQVWDEGGQLTREIHADGGEITRSFDAFGNQVQVEDAEGHTTRYGFDKLGRNISIKSDGVAAYTVSDQYAVTLVPEAVAGKVELTTTMEYDQAGRKIAQVNPNAERVEYTYDLRGNLIATEQPGGQKSEQVYDEAGRQVGDKDANGAVATWTFVKGQLKSHKDIGGTETFFAYDKANQLVAKWSSATTERSAQNLGYAYDAAGQLVESATGPSASAPSTPATTAESGSSSRPPRARRSAAWPRVSASRPTRRYPPTPSPTRTSGSATTRWADSRPWRPWTASRCCSSTTPSATASTS